MKKVLFLVLLLAQVMMAQSAESWLQKVRERFDEIDNFSADFVQDASSVFGSENLTVNGKITYATPNKFVISFGGQEIYCNGETVWNFNASQERVVINSFDDQFSTFTFDRFLYEIPEKSVVTFQGAKKGLSALKLVPENDPQFKEIIIKTDKKYNIHEIELTDQGGAVYNIALKNIKYNTTISDSFFNYSPKEGIKVIDFR